MEPRPDLITREESWETPPPGALPPALGCVAGFGVAAGLAVFAVTGWSGSGLPEWLQVAGLPGRQAGVWRSLLGCVTAVGAVAVAAAAAASGRRALSLLRCRSGNPGREAEGPCRLVQNAAGAWELQLETRLDRGGDAKIIPLPLVSTLRLPLDEAAAAVISRISSPGDDLRIRWLDLPACAGGPRVLAIASHAGTSFRREGLVRAA